MELEIAEIARLLFSGFDPGLLELPDPKADTLRNCSICDQQKRTVHSQSTRYYSPAPLNEGSPQQHTG